MNMSGFGLILRTVSFFNNHFMKKTLLAFFFSLSVLAMFAQQSPDGSGGFSDPDETYLEQPSISVYPNPATQFISIDNDEDVKTITIYNLVGRKLKTFQDIQKNERYDVSTLPNGMYLVQVISNSNKIITTQRISKR